MKKEYVHSDVANESKAEVWVYSRMDSRNSSKKAHDQLKRGDLMAGSCSHREREFPGFGLVAFDLLRLNSAQCRFFSLAGLKNSIIKPENPRKAPR